MLSHHNLAWTASSSSTSVRLRRRERRLLAVYLPLSHIAEQIISISLPVLLGAQVYFAESIEAMPREPEEVRPTFFFGVPRVWEKFKAKAEERSPRSRR